MSLLVIRKTQVSIEEVLHERGPVAAVPAAKTAGWRLRMSRAWTGCVSLWS